MAGGRGDCFMGMADAVKDGQGQGRRAGGMRELLRSGAAQPRGGGAIRRSCVRSGRCGELGSPPVALLVKPSPAIAYLRPPTLCRWKALLHCHEQRTISARGAPRRFYVASKGLVQKRGSRGGEMPENAARKEEGAAGGVNDCCSQGVNRHSSRRRAAAPALMLDPPCTPPYQKSHTSRRR